MEFNEVERRLTAGLEAFQREDTYLLEHDLSERCIAARLAMHLQFTFPEYSVDVEYNRAGDIPKRLKLPDNCANSVDDHGQALVLPDIIVHRRGLSGPNILGIELKKVGDRRGSECDRKRIRALRKHLRYEYGVLLECSTGCLYQHGIKVREWFRQISTRSNNRY